MIIDQWQDRKFVNLYVDDKRVSKCLIIFYRK